MTITIDLPPEKEQRLRDMAQRAGVPVEEYVLDLVDKQAPAAPVPELPEPRDEWEEWLINFAKRHPPVERHLTDEDLSRENIYEDRA